MRITHLSVKNWRTFKNLDVDVGQRLVVIGPNASGKSNLLDAVRFLRDLSSPGGGLQDAIASRGGLAHVRCLFARNNNRGGAVRVAVTLGDDDDPRQWTYEIEIRSEKAGRHRVVVDRELVRRGDEILLDRRDDNDDEDRKDPERLTQTALEQVSANKDFRPIAEFLAGVRYLHLVPQVIRDATRAGDAVEDPFGGDFIARMNRVPLRTREAWSRRVTEALQIAVPQFESLAVTVDRAGHPHLETRYTNWRGTTARQDERDMSDGTLRLIGLLWSLVEMGSKDAPVLMEEPELSLHPAVVRQLPGMLARAQRANGAQVMLTTHSPDLLSDEGLGTDEVLLLRPGRDGTTGTLVSDDLLARQEIGAGLTMAEVALPLTSPSGVEALVKVSLSGR